MINLVYLLLIFLTMVNTFITFKNYQKCAQNLDNGRLWKQVLEATQILFILEALHFIADYFDWDKCPFQTKDVATLFLERADWVRKTRKRYLDLKIRLICKDGKIHKVFKDNIPLKITKGDRYEIDGSKVKLWRKGSFRKPPQIYNTDKVLFPTDIVYSLGFSQHPCVRMWIGHEDSLKLYINEHLSEHLKRPTKSGNARKSSIDHFTISNSNICHPWWVTCTEVLYSHRASLFRKEQERNEPEWYITKKSFTNIPKKYLDNGYIWTCNLTRNQINSLINSSNIELKSICAPIISPKSKPLPKPKIVFVNLKGEEIKSIYKKV